MAEPREIQVGNDRTGVSIIYIKRRRVLRVGAWYDGGHGGMNSEEIKLGDFLDRLGISGRDCDRG